MKSTNVGQGPIRSPAEQAAAAVKQAKRLAAAAAVGVRCRRKYATFEACRLQIPLYGGHDFCSLCRRGGG